MVNEQKGVLDFQAQSDLRSHLSYAYDNRLLLQWLVFLRVVVASFIIGTIFLVDLTEDRRLFYVIVGIHILTTLLSALLIPSLSEKKWFLFLQVIWDFLFVTVLVFITGGYFSVFSFLYIISVIYASIILRRSTALFSAALCIAGFAVILVAQWLSLIKTPNMAGSAPDPTLPDLIYKVAMNAFAIFAAALLTSFLSERSKNIGVELKKRHTDLLELRARFEHIIRSIPIGIIALDQNDRSVFANASAALILKKDFSELEGKMLSEILPFLPDHFGLDTSRKDFSVRQGEERVFLEVGRSLVSTAEGTPIGSLVFLEDRTSIRRMEETVKRSDRLAAVGKLAAGIAHEIRNPLASISGSIQLLSKELMLDAVNRQLMDIVLRESERVNDLVSDFLAFARPSANSQCLVDAKGIAQDVLKMLSGQPSCHSGSVKILQKLEDRLYVRADPKNLRQLIWNLAINAVQAMPNGGTMMLKGSVQLQTAEGFNGKMVELIVSDTGVGIEEKNLDDLFDPFFTTKETGTGLGLTMCHHIVEMYNGRILVESELGRGAKFIVQLPAAERAGVIPGKSDLNEIGN